MSGITLFKFEPFSFEIQTVAPIDTVTTSTNLVSYVSRVDTNTVLIAGSNGYLGAPSSNESVRVVDTNAAILQSNFVLNAGRFFDVNAASFNNRTIQLFKNEPVTPILFDSCINLASIQSVPTLPPGLSFVSNTPSSFRLQGTPVVQTPTANYLVIGTGTNPSQIVTTRVFGASGSNGGINLGVGAERIQTDVSGATTISPMVVGIPITERVITSRVPTPGSANVQYSWPRLPDGLEFTKKDGTPIPGSFITIPGGTDPSFTLVLRGTPTLTGAKEFATAGLTSYPFPIQVFRTSPLPILSNTRDLTFQFEPMILFDSFSIPPLFTNVQVPSNISFRAQTYFDASDAVTSITQTGFPLGLDVSFVATEKRGYLVGTPQVAGSFTGTLFANAGTLLGSNPITISVSNDTITFVPPTATIDVSFIVSRPLTSFKEGYYTSAVQFKAIASSGANVTYAVNGIQGTGIESIVSNGILTLTGIPSVPLPPTTLVVTASSPTATGSTSLRFEIVNDVLTFKNLPTNLSFLQNREITPIQLEVETLSERSIQRFFSTTLPAGLEVTPTGIIQGAPLESGSGTFSVIASTGFVSTSSPAIGFGTESDNILGLLNPLGARLLPGQTIPPIQVTVVSKSGAPVRNIELQRLDASYGIVLTQAGESKGFLEGTFTDGTSANAPLLSNVVFDVQGTVGNITKLTPLTIQSQNGDTFRRYLVRNWYQPNGPAGQSIVYIYSQDDADTAQFTQVYARGVPNTFEQLQSEYEIPNELGITDFQMQYQKLAGYQQASNVILCARNRNFIARSLNGSTFTDVGGNTSDFSTEDDNRRIYQLAYINGETWLGIGYRVENGPLRPPGTVRIYKTTDNGSSWIQTKEFDSSTMGATLAMPRFWWIAYYTTSFYGYPLYAYIGSTCLRYKDGILIAGGSRSGGASTNSLLRSIDEGVSWSGVTGQFNSETYTVNLEGNVWLIGGSDLYTSEDPNSVYSIASSTIRYSTDQGQTWNATTGDFNFTCLDIVYGEGKWIAYGMSYQNNTYQLGFIYSDNGINWFPLSSVPSPASGRRFFTNIRVPPQDKIMFDGLSWNIYVIQFINPNGTFIRSFRHSRLGSLASEWTEFVNQQIGLFAWSAFNSIPEYDNLQQHNVLGPPGGGYFITNPQPKISAITNLNGKTTFYDPKL